MGLGNELRCRRLAAGQFGVVHRRQAREVGLTNRQVDHRLATGRWQRLYPGVYRVEGSPRTWRQQLKALSLWAGPGHALSHRAAAALWGFARFREEALELSVTRHLTLSAPVRVHVIEPLRPSELRSVEGFRVTSPTRTLFDLAASEDERTLRACLDEALRRKLTTLEALETALEWATHRRGAVLLRKLITAVRGGEAPTESELEQRVLELLDDEGLPRPTKQVRTMAGGRLRRLDFQFPDSPVVIEADGYATHSSVTNFERDRDRNNALIARGYRVLHWTWSALRHRPEELVAQLRRTLEPFRAASPPGPAWAASSEWQQLGAES